jgi:hypothetical protein
MSYVAGCPSSGTTISINSGELDLNTRLNVSFALSAGVAAAEAAQGALSVEAATETATEKRAAAAGPGSKLSPQTIISARER